VNRYQEPNKDVPASVAVVMLVALVGAWAYFRAPATFSFYATELNRYGDKHLEILSGLLVATLINIIWIGSVLSRLLGLNRQGKRLEILTSGRSSASGGAKKFPVVAILVGGIGSVFLYLFGSSYRVGLLPQFISRQLATPIYLAVCVDIGFSVFVVCSIVERRRILDWLLNWRRTALPEFPLQKNAIVLGAMEDISHD
jgi:hypothetical protein